MKCFATIIALAVFCQIFQVESRSVYPGANGNTGASKVPKSVDRSGCKTCSGKSQSQSQTATSSSSSSINLGINIHQPSFPPGGEYEHEQEVQTVLNNGEGKVTVVSSANKGTPSTITIPVSYNPGSDYLPSNQYPAPEKTAITKLEEIIGTTKLFPLEQDLAQIKYPTTEILNVQKQTVTQNQFTNGDGSRQEQNVEQYQSTVGESANQKQAVSQTQQSEDGPASQTQSVSQYQNAAGEEPAFQKQTVSQKQSAGENGEFGQKQSVSQKQNVPSQDTPVIFLQKSKSRENNQPRYVVIQQYSESQKQPRIVHVKLPVQKRPKKKPVAVIEAEYIQTQRVKQIQSTDRPPIPKILKQRKYAAKKQTTNSQSYVYIPQPTPLPKKHRLVTKKPRIQKKPLERYIYVQQPTIKPRKPKYLPALTKKPLPQPEYIYVKQPTEPEQKPSILYTPSKPPKPVFVKLSKKPGRRSYVTRKQRKQIPRKQLYLIEPPQTTPSEYVYVKQPQIHEPFPLNIFTVPQMTTTPPPPYFISVTHPPAQETTPHQPVFDVPVQPSKQNQYVKQSQIGGPERQQSQYVKQTQIGGPKSQQSQYVDQSQVGNQQTHQYQKVEQTQIVIPVEYQQPDYIPTSKRPYKSPRVPPEANSQYQSVTQNHVSTGASSQYQSVSQKQVGKSGSPSTQTQHISQTQIVNSQPIVLVQPLQPKPPVPEVNYRNIEISPKPIAEVEVSEPVEHEAVERERVQVGPAEPEFVEHEPVGYVPEQHGLSEYEGTEREIGDF